MAAAVALSGCEYKALPDPALSVRDKEFIARVPKADMGRVAADLGIDADLEGDAREIGRVEQRLLWADRQGMSFPPYILKALRESVDLYRESGLVPTVA